MFSRTVAGEAFCFTRADEIPDPVDRETLRRKGPRSAAVFPLAPNGDGAVRSLSFSSTTREQEWVPAIVERLRLVTGVISQALARKSSQDALDRALAELQQIRSHAATRTSRPRHEIKVLQGSRLIVSDGVAVKQAVAQVEQVAPTPATVLLIGETGTGKEVFAQAIHDLSPRHHRPMVGVSCAAIPSALIESELFGRERGAYTGALSRQIGRFEAANQSTLFLDEIGELPPEVQVKLLRVLQERVIERLGSTQPDQGRRPDHRGHEPQPRKGRRATRPSAKICSIASTCFPLSCRRCASASRTFRRWCGLHRRVLRAVRQDDRVDFEGQPARAAALPVARQRPRAAQRHRTRGDRRHRPAARRAGAAARRGDGPQAR